MSPLQIHTNKIRYGLTLFAILVRLEMKL